MCRRLVSTHTCMDPLYLHPDENEALSESQGLGRGCVAKVEFQGLKVLTGCIRTPGLRSVIHPPPPAGIVGMNFGVTGKPTLSTKAQQLRKGRETYQGTGKCSQAQCPCNFGWRRWQPENPGNLFPETKALRKVRLFHSKAHTHLIHPGFPHS